MLEIDARFPSQTPLCVYHSTGCNMIEVLANLFLTGKPKTGRPNPTARGAILEHIRLTPRMIIVEGEHIMADAGPLDHVRGFFGADEAITNYRDGRSAWVATLIFTGDTRKHAAEKREQVLASIQRRFKLEKIINRGPESTV